MRAPWGRYSYGLYEADEDDVAGLVEELVDSEAFSVARHVAREDIGEDSDEDAGRGTAQDVTKAVVAFYYLVNGLRERKGGNHLAPFAGLFAIAEHQHRHQHQHQHGCGVFGEGEDGDEGEYGLPSRRKSKRERSKKISRALLPGEAASDDDNDEVVVGGGGGGDLAAFTGMRKSKRPRKAKASLQPGEAASDSDDEGDGEGTLVAAPAAAVIAARYLKAPKARAPKKLHMAPKETKESKEPKRKVGRPCSSKTVNRELDDGGGRGGGNPGAGEGAVEKKEKAKKAKPPGATPLDASRAYLALHAGFLEKQAVSADEKAALEGAMGFLGYAERVLSPGFFAKLVRALFAWAERDASAKDASGCRCDAPEWKALQASARAALVRPGSAVHHDLQARLTKYLGKEAFVELLGDVLVVDEEAPPTQADIGGITPWGRACR